MRRSTATALACLAWSAGALARAQPPLDDARAAFYEADFEQAERLFRAALASPELDVPTATEAHRFLATTALLGGARDRALAHARAAVALDPTVAAPEGMSRVAPLLDEARAATGGRPLALEVDVSRAGAPAVARVAVRLVPDAGPAIDVVRVACSPSGDVEDLREATGAPGDEAITVTLDGPDAAREWRCSATAETEAGAALAVRDVRVPADDAPEPTTDSPSFLSRHWPWLVAGGAVALAILVTGVVVATSDGDDQLGPIEVMGW